MDQEKCGRFISERRRQKGLTQQELADALGVTNKAVSKWENGRGFPDVSLLEELSELLSVNIAELINGEPAAPAESRAKPAPAPKKARWESKRGEAVFRAVITALCAASIAGAVFYGAAAKEQTALYGLITVCLPTAAVFLFIKKVAQKLFKRTFSCGAALPFAAAAAVFAAGVLSDCVPLRDIPWRIYYNVDGLIRDIVCSRAFAASIGMVAGYLAEFLISAVIEPARKRRADITLTVCAVLPIFTGICVFILRAVKSSRPVLGDAPSAALIAAAAAAGAELLIYLAARFARKYRVELALVRKNNA